MRRESLKGGNISSCGCVNEIDKNDIVGKVFGEITVEKHSRTYREGKARSRRHLYWCRCTCGRRFEVCRQSLMEGKTSSCGCAKKIDKSDILGKKFGYWTVERYSKSVPERNGSLRYYYWCKCDCGQSREVRRGALLAGTATACGCTRRIDQNAIVGKRFGMLVVQKYLKFNQENGKHYYWCRCDCGAEKAIDRTNLILKCRSCGCRNPRNLLQSFNPGWKGCGDISGSYWSRTQKAARDRSLPFTISIEDAWQQWVVQNGKCALTGVPLKITATKYSPSRTASLDRRDSKRGYEIDNIQWVHKDINKMKMDFPQKRFIELCKLVAEEQSATS